jgi:hypothetical protein
MRAFRRARPEIASVLGLGLFADLADATRSDAPLRELGIHPRSVSTFAAAATAAAR